MAKTLEAHDKLIREIFGGDYQFEVPDYQRPYAWTTEHVEKLFDDLLSAMQNIRASGSTSQYFLGSIVLIKNGRDPKAIVVDGQQRLTTLTILFAALRAVWEADDYTPGVKSVTSFLYEEGDEILGRATSYRFTAREEDAAFFYQYIQKPGGIEKLVHNTDKLKDGRLHYRENATLLLNKVKALPTNKRNALWKFIANNCSLIVISTPDLEAAYHIFSTLNNRGLDLAPIDIIKAEVLGSIRHIDGKDKARACSKKWSAIENRLGRDALGSLLGHICTIYAKQKQQTTPVKEFREYVAEYKTPVELIDKVIEPYAKAWEFIYNANLKAAKHAEAINEYLYWLNRVDFKDWVPPALLYFKRFKQQPDWLKDFFKLLERLTYFLLVTQAGTNERIKTYTALIQEIESKTFDGNPAALTTFILKDTQKHKFVKALDGNVYESLPKARMALVLRLDSLMRAPGGQPPSVVSIDAVSIEHVLPQNPPNDSDWIKWFPSVNMRAKWVHRLANLILLDRGKNLQAGNHSFAQKKKIYFGDQEDMVSPFPLTQEVKAEKKWTPVLLEKRQQRLIDIFKKHWDLCIE